MLPGFSHETVGAKGSVEWYTPDWIFKGLDVEFDIDPASPRGGLPWIPAKKTYCVLDDGLSKPWAGKIWLNPPYGKETAQWLHRMNQHKNGIALVFARTDCGWFHDYAIKADAILFFKGRIKFVDENGTFGKSSPGAGSILIAWGSEMVDALKRVANWGCLIDLNLERVKEVV